MNSPPIIRPFVLWGIAIVLGSTAGLNLARTRAAAQTRDQKAAVQLGFESGPDKNRIFVLLDTPKIVRLSSDDEKLLDKYSSAPGNAPEFVAGVLDNIADDSTALRVVPLAQKLKQRLPKHVVLVGLPDKWESSGCHQAAQQLHQLYLHAAG